jgi:hypothetical protein
MVEVCNFKRMHINQLLNLYMKIFDILKWT